MKKSNARKRKGAMLAEAAAAMAVLFPVLVTVIWVVIEASYAYVIDRSMNNAASEAAKDLAIAYQSDPTANSDSKWTSICSAIRTPKFVADNSQFAITNWSPNSSPPTCTVTCTYLSGQNGLPRFPTWDPLNAFSGKVIIGTATYKLVTSNVVVGGNPNAGGGNPNAGGGNPNAGGANGNGPKGGP